MNIQISFPGQSVMIVEVSSHQERLLLEGRELPFIKIVPEPAKMKKTRIPYEEMKALYQKWMNGEITQAGFFLSYGWTRNDFFDEAYELGDNV